MKILHIHPSLAGGGIEAMICGLANTMAERENVSVCSIFEPKESDVFWKKLSPKVKRVTLGKRKPGFSVGEVFKILWLIGKGRYEVVNLHGFFYYYALTVLLFHHRVKFFYTVHSDAKMENSSWDRRFFPFKKFCFKKGWVHPITISHASQESFKQLYQCDSHLIYNGIAKPLIEAEDLVSAFRPSVKTKLFIHAGRIDMPKNQVVLCKVFKRLIDEGEDVVLLIAGSKQKQGIYDQMEPYFCDRIRYLGERSDIPQLMAQCDAMCLPSIWEGLPVTLLEALSMGCIPICSPVGGIPNVVEQGKNGCLSDSPSEEDYYQTMKSFLALSESKLKAMRARCKESFSNYDIEHTAESYLHVYQTVSA